MSIVKSAILGATARLRPILMTSLAMIIGLASAGCSPHGAGANGYQTLGTGAIGGMLIGMILQVLVVPALYVVFEKLQEKFKPPQVERQGQLRASASEVEQYSIDEHK